jgi:uncharacterized surface protein with fasciclin (FAS1) repeats
MNCLSKKTLLVFSFKLLCLSLLLFTAGCKKGFDEYYNESNTKGGFLYDKIKATPEFSIFAKGLERANLTQFISEGGLYTIFAPTNDAFSKYLSNNGYSSIDVVPEEQLFKVLSFHIVNNMWYFYDLRVRYATFRQTLYLTRNRKFVNIDVTATDTIKVNNIPVIKSLRDIDADNGVIHGIGEVLVPLPNLEEVFQSDPQLASSTFYKLLQVVKDSTFDRFNSYDKNRDGRIDSVFYKTYPLLNNVFTSIEYRQSTAAASQGGEPLFTTVLVPSNAALDALIAPALAKIPGTVPDKIAALSPSYVEALLESYFIADSIVSSTQLINRSGVLRSVNSEIIPATPDNQFVRKDIRTSNGMIHMINTTFPNTPTSVFNSAMGKLFTEPEYFTFLAAVQKANLMASWAPTIKTGTFFAPTNAAFAAINLDVQKMTLNGATLTTTQFSNLVRNHLINENLTKTNLTGTPSVTKNSDINQQLIFTNAGATVRTASGITANVSHPELSKGPGNPTIGWVYSVDQVLVPFLQ